MNLFGRAVKPMKSRPQGRLVKVEGLNRVKGLYIAKAKHGLRVTGFQVNPKAVSEITDRAKRYRARAAAPQQRHCFACGRPRPRDVHHIDGNESNGNPKNLTRACHSCNGKIAHIMRKAGLGTLTRQYNPKRRGQSQSARSLGAYLSSIMILKGEQPGNVSAAVRSVQATSPAQRAEYAKRIWEIRRERYGATGRSKPSQKEIPF